MVDVWHQCTPKCRSKKHATWLISAVTKCESDTEIILCLSKCYNAGLVTDELGHSVLHLAAAHGRKRIISWLCSNFRVNINAKDALSGWSPLHHALYHGNIDAAVALLQAGADLYMKDFNAHTPLDIMKSDIQPYKMVSDDADVFTWGQNSSYTLGQPNGQSKANPDILPIWSCDGKKSQQRRLLSISDVVMTKHTSFYLTSNGKVFACGSGRGGRLGLGSEQTVLVPTLIQSLSGKNIVSVSANVNHAAFVTNEGQLFVSGTNDHHQLGLGSNSSEELLPKIVRFKKDTKMKVVACGRFHTCVMSDRELYSCGLNAGQLGFSKDTSFQSEFKLVSSVAAVSRDSQGSAFLDLLACSDSATVVKTFSGEVFALSSYSCKRIASGCPSISHISVTGGRLDYTTAPDILRAEKGTDLVVLMLVADSGQVLVWREYAQLSQGGILRELRCTGLGRDLVASWVWAPMTATDGRILLCTTDGSAFAVTLPPSSHSAVLKDSKTKPSKFEWSAFHVADRGSGQAGIFRVSSYEIASSTVRLKHIHRALRIVADPAFVNFACIQARPENSIAELPIAPATNDLSSDLSKLFKSLSPYDDSTDVELVFGSNNCIYAHRSVLAGKSLYFRRLVIAASEAGSGGLTNMLSRRFRINVPDCEESEFRPLLEFAYTGQVDLRNYLVTDEMADKYMSNTSPRSNKSSPNSSAGKKNKRNSPKNAGSKRQNQPNSPQNTHLSEAALLNAQLLTRLIELAKRFGFGGNRFHNELEMLKTSVTSGRPYSTSFRSSAKTEVSRETLEDIADVWLCSTDGREFAAHRCVLSCRSDYFASMLAVGRWAEAGRAVVTQPVEADVLELAVTYIYSDWLGEVVDWRLLCKLVVYADQVFLYGLKSVAELQLSMPPRLNLTNCCQLIDFAHAYRAELLLPAATRFAIANMPNLLESHFSSMLIIEDDALAEVAKSYRDLVCPAMRNLHPWKSVSPYPNEIAEIIKEAVKTKLLVDDNWDSLTHNIAELVAVAKDTSYAANANNNNNNNNTVRTASSGVGGGRHRRVRRRSNNSESSDDSKAVPSNAANNSQHSPKQQMPPQSPSIQANGPMSPSVSSNGKPMIIGYTTPRRNNGWSDVGAKNEQNLVKTGVDGSKQAKRTGAVVSLTDIMADELRHQENDRKENNVRRPRQLPSLAWAAASSPPAPYSPLQVLATSPSNSKQPLGSPSASVRAWGAPASPLSVSPVPVLADILRQEQQRTENTRRQDRRSLHQIQLEERAIDELTKLYADLETHGVAVTVERLTVGVSAPTWAARSAPKVASCNTANNNPIQNSSFNFPALSSPR